MLASFCWGMSGSVTSVITGVTAYLAAVTKPEERINRLMILFTFTPLAATAGPGSAVHHHIGLRTTHFPGVKIQNCIRK